MDAIQGLKVLSFPVSSPKERNGKRQGRRGNGLGNDRKPSGGVTRACKVSTKPDWRPKGDFEETTTTEIVSCFEMI